MGDCVKIRFRSHATRARAERAYTIMIMDIIHHHDLHDDLDRYGIRGDLRQAKAVMTDMNERY